MSDANPSLFLTLQARDASALIHYLVETFGFVVAARHGDDEVVEHAQLNWPEGCGALMLGSHRPRAAWSREPGTAGAYLWTADPDALYQRVMSRGGDVVEPIGDTSFGSRQFAVRDPEGNLWAFGSYPGEPGRPD